MAVAPLLEEELAPEAEVVVVDALPTLAKLVAFLVAFGIICLVVAIEKAFFTSVSGAVSWIPGVGGWLKSGIHKAEQRVSHFMGDALSEVDAHIGYSWHQLARIGDRLGRDLSSLAVSVFGISAFLEQLVLHPRKGINAILGRTHLNYTYGKATAGKVAQIQHAQPRPGETATRAKHAAHAATAPVIGDLDVLERWASDRFKGLESQISDLSRTVEKIGAEAAPVALTGALAVAMGALGAEASRCSKTGRFNKMLCGMPDHLLESLLAGALIVATPISLVEFAKACQAFMSEAESGLRWFVRELD